jgi:hypothetical protein
MGKKPATNLIAGRLAWHSRRRRIPIIKLGDVDGRGTYVESNLSIKTELEEGQD